MKLSCSPILLLSLLLCGWLSLAEDGSSSRQCIQCDWKKDFCSWTASKSKTDGTVNWNRLDAVSTDCSSSECSPATPQPTSSSQQSGSLQCLSAGIELSPRDYKFKSSFLQIFAGMQFTCDGEISAWRYVSTPGEPSRRVYASVWERNRAPANAQSYVYSLVGWNLLSPGGDGNWQEVSISPANRIAVKQGYVVGLHYASLEMNEKDTVVPHFETVDGKRNSSTVLTYLIKLSHSQIDQRNFVDVNNGSTVQHLPGLVAIVTKKTRSGNGSSILGENYLTVESQPIKPVIGSAQLLSPPISSSGNSSGRCVFFRYSLKGNGTAYSKIMLSLQSTGSSNREILFTDDAESYQKWISNWVRISRRSAPYQIVFEGIPAAYGGSVALGIVQITPEPCAFTREMDIMIPMVRDQSNGYALGSSQGKVWPNGVIPYIVDSSFSSEEIAMMKKSMDVFQAAGTCIQFVTRTNERQYIRFRRPAARCGSTVVEPVCATYVGKQPLQMTENGAQSVFLDKRCFLPHGNIIHELAHVVGLWHETNRADADAHVYVNWENIVWDKKENFLPYAELGLGYDHADFDYDSVTHLPETAFATDGHYRTIASQDNPSAIFGQRYRLSPGDVNKIKTLYSSFPQCGDNEGGIPASASDENIVVTSPPTTRKVTTRKVTQRTKKPQATTTTSTDSDDMP